MCGICGFVNYRNDVLLEKMLDRMVHRGPDESGIYIEDTFISLGIRRLKVIDLFTGSQPIFNENKNIAVVCNGEIYNFLELRDLLKSKGHIFKTKSDVEVIVHLYEDFGLDFVKYLRGMFALALWDKKEKKLILARDHFGIKPLHYLVKDNCLFFSSELSPLYIIPEINFEVDKVALSHFFSLLYTPEPYTIIKQIRKLPSASLLVWKGNSFYIRKYWELKINNEFEFYKESYILEKIYELLQSSIKEQLISDVPLGVFLSGGLDSSTIVSFIKKNHIDKIKTFSIGFAEKDFSFNETIKAQIVSRYFNTEHIVEILTPQIEKILSDILEKSGEPFADSSIIPTYLLSQLAKKEITVALSGIGGDELFGGYPRYIGVYFAKIYSHTPLFLQNLLYNLSRILKLTYRKRDVISWIRRFLYVNLDIRQKYIIWMSAIDFKNKQQLFLDEELKKLNVDDLPQINNYEDIFYFDISTYLKDNLLFLADRASMANSLEIRVPFLDVRLVEFLSRISLKQKIKGFTLKYLLRKILQDEGLPSYITRQKKQGFQIPLSRWITEELHDLIGDYLSPYRIKNEGLINYRFLQSIIKRHINRIEDYSDLLFGILVWEMWREKFSNLTTLKVNTSVEITTKLKILLLNLGGIGDIIMMTPIIKALYDKYPNSDYYLLTIPRSREIAENISYFSKILILPIHYKMFKISQLKNLIKTLLELRREKFDFVINLRGVNSLLGMLKIFLIKKFIKKNFMIGYGKKFAKKMFDFFYQEDIVSYLNEVEETYKLLSVLGIKGKPDYIFYPLEEKYKQWAEKYIQTKTQKKVFIGFCPGSFRPSRRWPLEYWKELAYLITTSYSDMSVFIFGSKDEKKLAQKISSGLDSVIVTTDDTGEFQKLASLIEKMHIIVTNDTGLMHLAAALKRKVICLFGPGDVVKYVPYVEKNNLYVLRKDVFCKRPCYKYNCKNLECLKKILPQEVFKLITTIIKEDV
ncbi:MAG: asparagine synthase (glutamine-hydrolyzing) [Endomicrobia bacterium]|nr:asparagine synthase (glutamine-hydrolyzing) [Endomicrobiia bacterium]